MTRKITLLVNGAPISTDYFVQSFIDHTVRGILEALEGTGEMHNLSLSIDGDKVTINLNGAAVPLNPFATKIVRSTITGLASSLKGVSGINKLNLNIEVV